MGEENKKEEVTYRTQHVNSKDGIKLYLQEWTLNQLQIFVLFTEFWNMVAAIKNVQNTLRVDESLLELWI